MVYECRCPPAAVLLAVGNVAVGGKSVAQVFAVKSAVFGKCFGKADFDGVALCSAVNLQF